MNRQQALNQLRLMQAWHEDFGNGPCPDYDAICYAINIIEEAPEGLDNLIKALEAEHKKLREMQVVPPEKCEKCMMEHMDEMEKLEVELEMQKALPEIVHCKDCKNWIPFDWMFSETWQSQNMDDYPQNEIGCRCCDMAMKANDFCSRAERRTE